MLLAVSVVSYELMNFSVFLGAEVSARHLGTSADMSGQFGTSAEVSGTSAEMSWVRTVLGPKCLYTVPNCLDFHETFFCYATIERCIFSLNDSVMPYRRKA